MPKLFLEFAFNLLLWLITKDTKVYASEVSTPGGFYAGGKFHIAELPGREKPWGTSLRRLLSEYAVNPNEAKADIRRLYGGMGSFNDVILQDANGPLRSKNDVLDRLRSELYSASRELVAALSSSSTS